MKRKKLFVFLLCFLLTLSMAGCNLAKAVAVFANRQDISPDEASSSMEESQEQDLPSDGSPPDEGNGQDQEEWPEWEEWEDRLDSRYYAYSIHIEGEHRPFTALNTPIPGISGDESAEILYVYQVAEVGNKAIFYLYTAQEKSYLYAADKSTLQRTDVAEIPAASGEIFQVLPKGDAIYVLTSAKTTVYDSSLRVMEDVPLPFMLRQKAEGSFYPVQDYVNSAYFAGYDLTADFSRYYYADILGLHLYDGTTGQDTVLLPSLNSSGDAVDYDYLFPGESGSPVSDGSLIGQFWTPFLFSEEERLYVDYQDYNQQVVKLINLTDGSVTDFEAFNAGLVSINDDGILIPYLPLPEQSKGTPAYGASYLDYRSGNFGDVEGAIIANSREFDAFTGLRYGATLARTQKILDETSGVFAINLVDLETKKASQPVMISYQATATSSFHLYGASIVGVLDDGRVIFSLLETSGETMYYISENTD